MIKQKTIHVPRGTNALLAADALAKEVDAWEKSQKDLISIINIESIYQPSASGSIARREIEISSYLTGARIWYMDDAE